MLFENLQPPNKVRENRNQYVPNVVVSPPSCVVLHGKPMSSPL